MSLNKKQKIMIKKAFLLFFISIAMMTGYSQSDLRQQERAERRAARQAQQAAELAQSRAEMIKLVNDTTFVLEANTFIGPFGQEAPLSSFQNYFAIDGKYVAINIAFNNAGSFGPPGPTPIPSGWGGPWTAPGFPGWNWQSWDTPDTPARLVQYDPDMSQSDGPYIINGSFRTWTGVIPVQFTVYVQQNGLGRIVLTTNSGYQVTFSGNIVSPQNASTIYPIP